jgi:hypothetical protein
METPHLTKREEFLQSLKDFFEARSAEDHQAERLCPRCGAAMRLVHTTFWLYETDSSWDLRVPVCACASRSTRGTPDSPTVSEELLATTPSKSPARLGWKELYRLAVFEEDKNKILQRIADAEREILARERSLFYAVTGAVEERKALESALYALQVLRSFHWISRKSPGSSTDSKTDHAAWNSRA